MKHAYKIAIIAVIAAIAFTALAFKPLSGVTSKAISCGTTAVIVAGNAGFNSVLCSNINSTEVYLGGSDVATTNGVPICDDSDLCVGASLSIDTHQGELYCRTAADTVEIRCIMGN